MSAALSAQQPLADLVHPLVGTQSEGQTYPAAGVPFAMTHWTPQTRAGELKCIAPYYYTDAKIQGFRGTHFLSGGCLPDYGSMTVMPGSGTLKTDAVERASTFAREAEHATPYEYSVALDGPAVQAEITGTLHAGLMRFRYTRASAHAWLVLENNARGGDGWVRYDPLTREVSGNVPVRREYAGSGNLAGFSGYFVIQFDRNPVSHGTWIGQANKPNAIEQVGDGLPLGVVRISKTTSPTGDGSAVASREPTAPTRPGFGVYVDFGPMRLGEAVQVRIGTSFVSLDEARRNLNSEIPTWEYTRVRDQARAAWNAQLGKIRISGRDPARTVFYTSLYHAMLHPRTYSDGSGSYPRFASNGAVEAAHGFTYYDDFSLWDIFRAQLPLLTILDPARVSDMMRSLVAKGEQGGFLPSFPAWNSYTSEMVGDHATVALVDAWRKGIRGFDAERAYVLMRRNATELPAKREEYVDGKGRRGLDAYLRYGFIPVEEHMSDAFHKDEQVSRTLEYAFDDAILAQFAATLGKHDDAALFAQHGEFWRKVLDPATGFARARHQAGQWVTAVDPGKRPSWITEGSPWVYTFFVPQNIPGLIDLEHGKQAFVAKLDALFAGGFYDHGNEPSHHIAYLYDAAGAPEKTQQRVRALMESEYKDGPGGLAGNDDAGQMSAWYVMSAMGLYQVTPGVPEYSLGSPRFDDLRVSLPGGKTLHITAPGAESGKVYVRHITLNGRPVFGWTLTHQEVIGGGELQFEMSERPPR